MLSNKKVKDQIEAIEATAESALRHIRSLKEQIDQLQKGPKPNPVRLNKLNSDLDELVAKLKGSLERVLLDLKTPVSNIKSTKNPDGRL